MKKILALIVIGVIGYFAYGYYTNNMTTEQPEVDNSKMVWSIDESQQISLKTGNGSEGISPAQGTLLNPGELWQGVSTGKDDWLVCNIYAAPDSSGYLNTTTIHVKPTGAPQGTDGKGNPDGFLTFTYVKDTLGMPWYTIKSSQVVPTPPVIDNDGWNSGQTGKDPFATPGSYWVQDYNFDDKGRWSVKDGAVYQNTDSSKVAQQPTYGSRAYPVNVLNDKYDIDSLANGVAYDGVWQIDVKIGSTGTLNKQSGGEMQFCETFYIAERVNMMWNNKYYLDGSPDGGSGKGGQYGREIDIMETSWNGGSKTEVGPQFNLPNTKNTGWSLNNPITTANGIMKAQWSEFYGAPSTDFATFGVAILDDGLYFYGYKGDTQIYAYGPVVKDNTYDQVGPFVAYIGTWCLKDNRTPGGFETGYKNFIYKAKSDVTGNPVKNKENFGPGLK